MYYVSKALTDAESRYPKSDKIALALVTATQKLRPNFQAYPVIIMTSFPLQIILAKSDASGRLLKWSVELGEFDISFRPRTVIKGQVIADLIADFSVGDMEEKMVGVMSEQVEPPLWQLWVDGSSNKNGSGVGLILQTPEGDEICCSVCISFKTTNNGAEYEAIISGVKLGLALGARNLIVKSDS